MMCSEVPTTSAVLRPEIKICCVFVQWSPIMTELGMVLSIAESCEALSECVIEWLKRVYFIT